MGTQLKKKCDEFIEEMKKQDKALLELLKRGHGSLIIQVIKDYLSSYE